MSNKRIFLTSLTIVAALAVAIPLIAHTENIRSTFRQDTHGIQSTAQTEARATATEAEPQVVSLHVTPAGFETAETIAHRGRFLILLQNRTGQRDLKFWLARENQERLAQSEPQQRDWQAQVQLGPGTYVIGETNHPEWKSIIRVSN